MNIKDVALELSCIGLITLFVYVVWWITTRHFQSFIWLFM